jgi:hypothetical protein
LEENKKNKNKIQNFNDSDGPLTTRPFAPSAPNSNTLIQFHPISSLISTLIKNRKSTEVAPYFSTLVGEFSDLEMES